jgi:hypothetical protein
MGREEEIRLFFHGSPSTLVWSSVVEVNRRAAAWGLPFCLIMVVDLGFLFLRQIFLDLAGVVSSGRLRRHT